MPYIEAGAKITKCYYVGGWERGYDVRIVLSRQDILGMLSEIIEIERDNDELLSKRITQVREDRYYRFREQIKHEEKNAKRRENYKKKHPKKK